MSDLKKLSEEQLREIRELAKIERDARVRRRPADFFPWHDIQKWILEVCDTVSGDLRIMLIAGGNRGGKSKVAMGFMSRVLRRTSGLNKQLLTTDRYTGEIVVKSDRDPLTIWIVPPTLEKARNDWISPQDQMGIAHWIGDLFVDVKHSPDLVFYARPPGLPENEVDTKEFLNCDKILIKSQDQALETFESSEVDLVIFDEEVQKQKIWNSCLMRVGTTHGMVIMAYTPLHGLSWSFKTYWKPIVKEDNPITKQDIDRCWIYNPTKSGEEGPENIVCAQMGSADNPRARTYAKEIEHSKSMSEAEKASRLYGEYGYVEGALLPALAGIDILRPLPEHAPYVVDALPGWYQDDERVPGSITDWFLVADPNKSYGATLAGRDSNGNLFFVAEHLEESWPDRRHADSFKEMEKLYNVGRATVHRYADPGSAGAQSIVNMQSLGVSFDTMPKGAGSVSASIKKLRGTTYVDPSHSHPITGRTGAPRVYFYRPGLLRGGKMESELASQLSQARQTDNESAPVDTPHKDIRSKLDLFDCARYTAIVADDIPVTDQLPSDGLGVQPEDRLPTDHQLDYISTTEVEPGFYVPEYDFGGDLYG